MIGTRTFDKGSRRPRFLHVTGALHFTAVFYFTPPGRSIQAREIYLDVDNSESVPAERRRVRGTSVRPGRGGHPLNASGNWPGLHAYVPEKILGTQATDRCLDFLHFLERAVR